jgi:hypothetical protein
MIVETSANYFYRVWETNHPELQHLWYGQAVKRRNGHWTNKATKHVELVRKAGCRVVEAE